MFTTIALAASLATLTPADRADLECMAVFSFMAADSDKLTAEQKAGVAGATMYYYGRIEGRQPEIEINGLITELVTSKAFLTGLQALGQRCGSEMIAKGKALQAMGKSMTESAAKGASQAK